MILIKTRHQPQKNLLRKNSFQILPHLRSALEGKSGSIVEKFEGKESQITFLPYDLFQNKRILLLVQSCNSDEGNESNKCIDNNMELTYLMRIF